MDKTLAVKTINSNMKLIWRKFNYRTNGKPIQVTSEGFVRSWEGKHFFHWKYLPDNKIKLWEGKKELILNLKS
jgi:hypothetical protein